MRVLPKYETVVRELTYAVSDLVNALAIAAARSEYPNRNSLPGYRIQEEYGAVILTISRLKGALATTIEYEKRLEQDIRLIEKRVSERRLVGSRKRKVVRGKT